MGDGVVVERLQKTYRNNHIEKKKLRNTGQLQQVFIEDDHEAIIKKDVFRTVAEKRQRRSTNKGVRRECTALTGMIRCPYCGKNYRRKSAARCIKWCCATFNTKGKKFCPESKMIPEDTVIEAVCAVLNMDEYDEREFLDCVILLSSAMTRDLTENWWSMRNKPLSSDASTMNSFRG